MEKSRIIRPFLVDLGVNPRKDTSNNPRYDLAMLTLQRGFPLVLGRQGDIQPVLDVSDFKGTLIYRGISREHGTIIIRGDIRNPGADYYDLSDGKTLIQRGKGSFKVNSSEILQDGDVLWLSPEISSLSPPEISGFSFLFTYL